ncbi:MAG: arginine--tRNA ligase [Bacteroidetes bacterium GWF2_49_14]|nr:MAG: arginine--tRNA ligase [Bacteroidetes bacterium GWF2_49_14]HBB91183.1 arginine--tRNA ligase [Bacteroidales bacterium]
MERIEKRIAEATSEAIRVLYQADITEDKIQVQATRKEQAGDFTVVVFAYSRISGKNPEQTGHEIGQYLKERLDSIDSYEVIKGFLNLSLSSAFWMSYFRENMHLRNYGHKLPVPGSAPVVVEYSSPNTNKPLHLGHIRNNLLGYAVSKIVGAAGNEVRMVNLVNDRGIHICKSMLAWQKWGEGITPEAAGLKGDKLVGDFYVRFDKAYKVEIKELMGAGMKEEEAKNNAPLIREAQELLRKWENGEKEVIDLWNTMNGWVYKGFDETYRKLGVTFDKIYYESNTYKLGKDLVSMGLANGVLYQKEDGSVWADLTEDGLDHKLLLRSDGTSVYMTQDLGTAHQRFEEYGFTRHIYVVGNEQDYHFKVLSLILKKIGFAWAEKLYHLSYGMVELPQGRMKSREGTVVDADDLIDEMVATARSVSNELGKLDGFPEDEKAAVYYQIALGALKYYILKVDPQKTMMFNPEESIDFNGNTGPFIQYTCVRIRSVERKALDAGIVASNSWPLDLELDPRESALLKRVYGYPGILTEAAQNLSPALIANYFYELVKEYNHFYQQCPIVRETDVVRRDFRLALSRFIANHIQDGMILLGIEMPERM